MTRIKLVVSYIGTDFSGWQIQAENQGRQARTVQDELEKALFKILGQHVRTHASGRTDAGVHADMQIVHFDVPDAHNIKWQQALNHFLPPDIAILESSVVDENFHARFNALTKKYVYSVWLNFDYTPPKIKNFVWTTGKLDLEKMTKASHYLIGKHDFAGFQNKGSDPENTERTIFLIDKYFLPLPGSIEANENYLAWSFVGNGFLKQMVRNMMGFLVYVGMGKLEPVDALKIINSGERTVLDFPSAPPAGLTLAEVRY